MYRMYTGCNFSTSCCQRFLLTMYPLGHSHFGKVMLLCVTIQMKRRRSGELKEEKQLYSLLARPFGSKFFFYYASEVNKHP